MNTTPRLNWQGYSGEITNPGCGRIGVENHARAFWQSRHNLPEPPQLTDLHALAKSLRASNEDEA